MYDFDKPFIRENTESVKWDLREEFGNASALPMWVADMDFPTSQYIIDGLTARVAHGAFGYTTGEDKDKAATISWYARRHGCTFGEEDILFSPGVVDSIYHVLKACRKEGDKVVIQSPVYGPFRFMTEKAKMTMVENFLLHEDGTWKMDIPGLEQCFKDGANTMILCSPHNPVGRVWTKEELTAVAELCDKYDVLLISDEIHADFELGGSKHTCMISLREHNTVQLISATKSFNLAALRHSAIICKDAGLREKVKAQLTEVMADVNLFGRLATRLAYEGGEEWLDEMLAYLTEGRDILEQGIRETGVLIPSHVEGTYLMWVDCRALGRKNDELKEYFIKEVGIIPNDGLFFGACADGFIRLNFATSHANIRKAVALIKEKIHA